MERHEAIAVLKELICANLIQPTMVYLKQTKIGHYEIIIKGECDPVEVKQFITKKNLTMLVDEEKGICRIHKPTPTHI